jgi:hypothetical protein
MADFSDLCPLFKTGVKNCVYVPRQALSSMSTTARVLGMLPPFGRSITVTTVYLRPTTKWPSTTAGTKLYIGKASSQLAASTVFSVFASLMISKTYTVKKWYAMTITAKNFSPADVIRAAVSSKETNAKGVELRLRYQEK